MRRLKPSVKGKKGDKSPPDRLTVRPQRGPFDADAISWLIGQAIARLNSDQDGYKRTVELLARLDSTEAFAAVLKSVPREDVPLRWSLLYVLAETGDLKAADLFARIAAEPIRIERVPGTCESAYDGELLVRTIAIEALAELAARDPTLVERLYDVLRAQSDRALRIEGIKGILAAAPDEARRLKKALPKDLHFALKLELVSPESLSVEFDSKVKDAGRPPPSLEPNREYPVVPDRDCCMGS